jgi:hypothetical protein
LAILFFFLFLFLIAPQCVCLVFYFSSSSSLVHHIPEWKCISLFSLSAHTKEQLDREAIHSSNHDPWRNKKAALCYRI